MWAQKFYLLFIFCLGVTRYVAWAVVSVKQIKGDAGKSSSSAGDVSSDRELHSFSGLLVSSCIGVLQSMRVTEAQARLVLVVLGTHRASGTPDTHR